MTDEPQQGAVPAAESTPAEQTKATAPPAEQSIAEQQRKLTRGQWREQARVTFRVSPHAVAGALHDRDDDELLTEGEVRSALDAFSIAEGLE